MVLAVGLSCYNSNARTQTRGWSRRRLSLANAVCTPIDRTLLRRLPEGSSRELCSASSSPRELLLVNSKPFRINEKREAQGILPLPLNLVT